MDDTSSAITVTHCLTMRAHDYHKKSSVVRVTTADWHVFLLQATLVIEILIHVMFMPIETCQRCDRHAAVDRGH